MPIALLKAYAAMLPRLEAEEQLARITAGGLAFGGGEARDRRQMLDALEQQAKGPRAKASPVKADPADLAAMGIGLKAAGDLPVIGSMQEWLGQEGPDHG